MRSIVKGASAARVSLGVSLAIYVAFVACNTSSNAPDHRPLCALCIEASNCDVGPGQSVTCVGGVCNFHEGSVAGLCQSSSCGGCNAKGQCLCKLLDAGRGTQPLCAPCDESNRCDVGPGESVTCVGGVCNFHEGSIAGLCQTSNCGVCNAKGQCICNPPDASPDGATETIIPPHDTTDVVFATYASGPGKYSWTLQGLATTLTAGTGFTVHETVVGLSKVQIYTGSPDSRTNVPMGDISVVIGGATIGTASPDAMNNYFKSGSGTTPFATPGATIHLGWTGSASVPAGAGDVVQGSPVTVTDPPVTPPGQKMVIDTKVPLHIAFTGTSPGTLTVTIFGGDGLSAVVTTVPTSAPLAFDVAAAALAFLGKGTGAFFISQQSSTEVIAGARNVNVRSVVYARASDGTDEATVQATIE
jgi:hypothetical protein